MSANSCPLRHGPLRDTNGYISQCDEPLLQHVIDKINNEYTRGVCVKLIASQPGDYWHSILTPRGTDGTGAIYTGAIGMMP